MMLAYHGNMTGRLTGISLIDYFWHLSNCSSKGAIFCDWVLGGEDQFTKAFKTEAFRYWWGWPMDSLWHLWRYICLMTSEWTTTPGSFLILQQHELILVLSNNSLLFIIKHGFFFSLGFEERIFNCQSCSTWCLQGRQSPPENGSGRQDLLMFETTRLYCWWR